MRGSLEPSDGVFVVLEGVDGSGTEIQAGRYAAHLRARRRLVHVTEEPSSGPIGAQIRLVLRNRLTLSATHQAVVMTMLFAADRLDHLEAEIAPHLRDGYVVISDRYDLSSLAYQTITSSTGGDAGGAPSSRPPQESAAMLEWIRTVNRFARRPDVTVVLDASPAVAAARRRARGGPAEIFDDAELQARLGLSYLRAEHLVPGDRVIHVDGDRDDDTVAAAVAAAVEPFVSSRTPPVLR